MQVVWQPYQEEDNTDQPWVSQGRDQFGKEIWLHYFNEVEFLLHRVVMKTLGLHQAIVDIPAREIYGRPRQSFRGRGRARDWRIECTAQIADWDEGGAEVGSEAESSVAYLTWYRRAYRERLQLGRPYPVSFSFDIFKFINCIIC